MDKYEINVGVKVDDSKLNTLKTDIQKLTTGTNTIKLTMDATNVTSQIKLIEQQLQNLSKIKINLNAGNNSGGGNIKGAMNQVSAYQKALRETYNISKQISSMDMKVAKLKTSDIVDSKDIAKYETELNNLKATYQNLMTSLSSTNVNLSPVFAEIDKSKTKIAELSSVVDDAKNKLATASVIKFDNSYATDLERIDEGLGKIETRSTETANALQQFNAAVNEMNVAKQSGDVDKINASYERYQYTLKSTEEQIKRNINAETLSRKATGLSSKMDIWLKKNSAAAEQFGAKIQNLQLQLQNLNSSADLSRISDEFQEITRQATLAGKTGQTFGDRLKTKIKEYSVYLSSAMIISQSVRALRDMYDNVHKVDTAMTELYRVTDLSSSQYSTLYDNMAKSAKEYGATLDGIISSTASWVRLGFNANDANGLAELTSMYQHVTDLDEPTAVNNLVTAYKGFEQQLLELNGGDSVKAVEMAMDIYDKLGNEFALSAADVGSGLSKAASTLQMAGNTIQESAGM